MIRLAVVTWSISHFEVPFYRILSYQENICARVYYVVPPEKTEKFDPSYQQGINWGEDMLGGYSSEQSKDWRDMLYRVRKWAADVILIYGYSWPGALKFAAMSRFLKIPLILRGTLNYNLDPSRNIFAARLTRMLRPTVFRMFDAYHYGGSYSKEVLYKAGIPRDKLFFVPFSVGSSHFLTAQAKLTKNGTRERTRKELGWSNAYPIILFIGQLNWFKGPDIAIEVFCKFFSECPDARLIVLGNGAMMGKLQEMVSRYSLPNVVFFGGFCPSKETTKFYISSDIVLFTSRYETWARSINEAMLCGCPCIVNKIIPASGGLVEHRVNGFIVQENNVDEYLAVLRDFVKLKREEKLRMSEMARKAAWSMSYEEHVTDLRQSIEYAASL